MKMEQILHNIAMGIQEYPECVALCNAGWTATSGSIRITDADGNKFVITVQVESQGDVNKQGPIKHA